MESDILDGLDQVGYSGVLVNENALLVACEQGFSSREYENLCTWLTTKLNIEIQKSGSSDDPEMGMVELSALLKELSCPYKGLASGLIKGELNKSDHLKVILFLVSELQAAQIMASKTITDRTVEKNGTPLQDLQAICKTLNLPEPVEQQSSELFSSIENQVKILLKKVPEKHVGKPVLKQSLTSEQWRQLEKINHVLCADYECRRRTLAKRLDVTVQSFSWSDRAQEKIDKMAKAYQPKRHGLTLKSSVSLAHVLAAREDVCNVVKTSSGSNREKTACAVNRVLMGRVPDRGGRPSEIDPPLPEMPPWQKRQDGGGRGGYRGGGYGGGGYGGGGSKGGWGHGGGGSKGGWGHGGGGGRGHWGKEW